MIRNPADDLSFGPNPGLAYLQSLGGKPLIVQKRNANWVEFYNTDHWEIVQVFEPEKGHTTCQ